MRRSLLFPCAVLFPSSMHISRITPHDNLPVTSVTLPSLDLQHLLLTTGTEVTMKSTATPLLENAACAFHGYVPATSTRDTVPLKSGCLALHPPIGACSMHISSLAQKLTLARGNSPHAPCGDMLPRPLECTSSVSTPDVPMTEEFCLSPSGQNSPPRLLSATSKACLSSLSARYVI